MHVKSMPSLVLVVAVACSLGVAIRADDAGSRPRPGDCLETLRVPDHVDWSVRLAVYGEDEFDVTVINRRWDGTFEYATTKSPYAGEDPVRVALDQSIKALKVVDGKFEARLKALASLGTLKAKLVPSSDIVINSKGMKVVAATRSSLNTIELVEHEDDFERVLGVLRALELRSGGAGHGSPGE